MRQESGEGLTLSQNSALASIERHGGLTPSELATVERVQRPTATRVLSALSEHNLVTREADASDRRIARLKVTREGAAILKRGRSRKNAYLARRMRDLGPDDLETLARAAELIEHMLEGDDERR
jgi:DNA-binding MarR family transcriptional regulator